MDAMNAQKTRWEAGEWSVSIGLFLNQVFPKHVVLYLCRSIQDYSLDMLVKHLPFTQCTPQWCTFFNSVDKKVVLAHDCRVNVVEIVPSTISHISAGLRCFAMKSFGVGQVINVY